MKKILKRWGTLLLGIGFLKAFDIANGLFIEEKLQFIYKVLCLVAALISFFISIVSDQKLKENRGILYLSYISILIMCVAIVIVVIAGGKYFI